MLEIRHVKAVYSKYGIDVHREAGEYVVKEYDWQKDEIKTRYLDLHDENNIAGYLNISIATLHEEISEARGE